MYICDLIVHVSRFSGGQCDCPFHECTFTSSQHVSWHLCMSQPVSCCVYKFSTWTSVFYHFSPGTEVCLCVLQPVSWCLSYQPVSCVSIVSARELVYLSYLPVSWYIYHFSWCVCVCLCIQLTSWCTYHISPWAGVSIILACGLVSLWFQFVSWGTWQFYIPWACVCVCVCTLQSWAVPVRELVWVCY